jgi:hypothetical protein
MTVLVGQNDYTGASNLTFLANDRGSLAGFCQSGVGIDRPAVSTLPTTTATPSITRKQWRMMGFNNILFHCISWPIVKGTQSIVRWTTIVHLLGR